MFLRVAGFSIVLYFAVLTSCYAASSGSPKQETDESWLMSPFQKQNEANPILGPVATTEFLCPIQGGTVAWEAKDIFNPTALVKDGKIHLLYRAEDVDGEYLGTSRIGLATSDDGVTFVRETKPIFYPDNDSVKNYEWEGGCEDPRIVESESGEYVMTYTGYNGSLAILMVATTKDLRTWTKYGPVFRNTRDFAELWSKSGSIVTVQKDGKFVAEKIDDKYWMYWGDTDLYLATSNDLVDWTPITNADGNLTKIVEPREGLFDSELVEPGPQAFIRDDGILLIYNSKNKKGDEGGDPTLPEGTYAAGQLLFDKTNPQKVLKRSAGYFMKPEEEYEIVGQVGNVVFLEGLVCYKGTWFIYYGTADSKIAVATRKDEYCSGSIMVRVSGSALILAVALWVSRLVL
ncbi:1,4-beta-mannosyl-N-acetylglucosamine phosphorylase-like [Bradysia coprophila]|uniref:1,4-beta-mannosyl-N-acetylglucosamine phosphorylase-like n=1 Tax=Bradysia coprophila TaxID=38358 RepID=UPI00187DA434|nr:1,4-beta-mannosyl-N-acetylglucosamine phosphorylase-like [Bradysia coprophila]